MVRIVPDQSCGEQKCDVKAVYDCNNTFTQGSVLCRTIHVYYSSFPESPFSLLLLSKTWLT